MMDEYDRWLRSYEARRRLVNDAKWIGIVAVTVLATIGLVTAVYGIAGWLS